ncbi:MAG TPA: zf-HC2 domain-containing protein [Anaeromyxobacteraceae bacterium]
MSIDPDEASAAMNCAELARSIDAYLDGELAAREQGEADEHLAGCERCRRLAELEGKTRAALRASLQAAMGPGSGAGAAPQALRERIHLSLVHDRKPLWRRLLAPVPIAALAACAAGVLLVFATHGGSDPLVDEAVRKHTRDLPLEVTAAAVGPDSVARWFAGKLDFNAAPLRFRNGDVHLVGARLSHIQDRPAAYVRYDLPRGHLGLFILDDPERRFGEIGRVVQAGPATVRLINSRGFNVAVWRRNEIVYSLVSDLDEDDLARLVQTAQGLSDR